MKTNSYLLLKTFIFSIFGLVLVLSLCTCKKYPEDGKISLWYTVNQRLDHEWQLIECTVNGINKTSETQIFPVNVGNYFDTICFNLINSTLQFKYYKTKNNQGKNQEYYESQLLVTPVPFGTKTNPDGIGAGGSYELLDSKKKLRFNNRDGASNTYYVPLLYNPTEEAWDIRKLTDKEFIIETTNSSNQLVRIKFYRLF